MRCLVSVVRASGRLPALHFHHALTGICPPAVAPSSLVEERVPASVRAGCESPARRGEGRLGKQPHFGLRERHEEDEQQSTSCTLQVLEFAKGLKEAGDGP